MRPLEIDMDETRYKEIETVLLDTEDGRAFLRERDRRAVEGRAEPWAGLLERFAAVAGRLEVAAAGPPAPSDPVRTSDVLMRELQRINNHIHETRREIAALKPLDSGSSRITAATGELGAIVSATERATSEILSAAEGLGEIPPRLRDLGHRELADEIEGRVTDLLMACSFQDITGQRTTKVVNTLRYIEQRVRTMIEIWGVAEAGAGGDLVHRRPDDTRADAHLMNGPPLTGALEQGDVDALFEALDMSAAMAEQRDLVTEPPERRTDPLPAKGGAGEVASQADIDALFD